MHESDAPEVSPADLVAARQLAEEMKQQAGQQGAVRVAARHFADQITSSHYPASPGDGVLDGAKVALAIESSLGTYEKAVRGYRMEEKISIRGNVITITSFTTGTHADGGRYEDVSMVAYHVHNGKIGRADAIHTNPAAIQKALRGSAEREASDHAAAIRIAEEMRGSSSALEVAQKYFAERVATWSPESLDKSALLERSALSNAIDAEVAALRKALHGYAATESVSVRGNKVLIDNMIVGSLDGERIAGDSKLVLSVTEDTIVGFETSHSAEGRAQLLKVLSAVPSATSAESAR